MRAMFAAIRRGLKRGLKTHILALLTLIGLGIIALLVLSGGVYVASQNPRFCSTCHYMKPYVDQWQESSHADVSCVACHPVRPLANAVSAIRYFTGTQTPRPMAEVASDDCLQSGCHDARLSEGESTFADGKILFDHTPHLERLRRGKKLQCTSCHSQIVQGEHISVTEETCFLCHFKGAGEAQAISGCTSCHGTPAETVQHEGFVFSHDSYLKVGVACQQCHLQVTSGDGKVLEERCFSCHVERLEQFDDSEFIHATHVTEHDIDCFKCHEKIQHGGIRMIRALETSCENCHKSLHLPQKEMYIGSGGRGLPDIPSRMFAAQVSCDGCHTRAVHIGTPEFEETSLEAQRQSCVTCHGEDYDLMLDDWFREMDHLEKNFQPELERVQAVLQRLEQTDADLTEARLLVEKAEHNYDFLKFGRGVHNVEYAVRMIQAAAGYLDRAMSLMQPDYHPPARSHLLTAPDGYCTVLCHARLGLPEETRFDHLTFPHQLHVEDIEVECTQCHSPEKHKMQVITRSECMSCHHEAQDIACGHCHLAQEALYTGEVANWDVEGAPDFMAEEDVECVECHDLSSELSIAAIQETCIDCHEVGYDETLREWINQMQATLGNASLLLEKTRREAQIARSRRQNTAEADALLEQAEKLIQLVEKGKGAHNYELSLELIQQADAKLQKAQELVTGVSLSE